ncbi:embryonic protein UVS.2-like isoform X2 [Pseudophryne corroboree]|uniref:embryonic protein UVS.2-like isoform X2 n=1 Tax=Pseudophryne corroboree TaxID=495146 RepID=UPI0030816AB6
MLTSANRIHQISQHEINDFDPNTPDMIKTIGKFHKDPKTLNMIDETAKSHSGDTDARHQKRSTLSNIIEVNKGYNLTVHDGDILMKTGRSATNCTNCLWPKSADGTVPVPYNLSSVYNANQVNLFKTAMEEIETLTCVRFVPRTTEKDYINIISGNGCASFVGRLGGGQMVGLSTAGCMYRGIIEHELDHALGFYHEHMRSDRDNYINVNFQYISPGEVGNFQKAKTNNLGLEYDYGSVMHYGNYDFSNTSNQPTLVPKPDPTVPIGQRAGLSILDISKINRLYQCNVCAYLLNAQNGTMTSANYPSAYPSNADCVWLIRSPSGQATLSFSAFDVQSSPDCTSDYIRIYDGPSTTSPVLLDKTCGTGLIPLIVASTNQMLVEFTSDSSVTGVGFKASYSSVQCGGNFFGVEGNFTSPGYPTAYNPNMDCTFNITAPVGYRISLSVSDFQLEYSQYCLCDYMEVLDHSDVYGPFCGTKNIPYITSSGNTLAVVFHSDRMNQMKGFLASFNFI